MGWQAALTGDVRANAAYRLWSLDSLPHAYRRKLEDLGVDAARVFGFLIAQPSSGLPDKVVDKAAADLFVILGRPGRPPANVRKRLAGLVLDGVLEVETATGFVSGPLAYDALQQGQEYRITDDRLGRLAQAALAYAARLRIADPHTVTARLYAYHRIPQSKRWARAYPGPGAVLDILPQRILARNWIELGDSQQSHWLSWTFRGRQLAERSNAFPYKLYVSPRIEQLPDVLPPLIEALTDCAAPRFKIGADAAGLLRPDKIVVYLPDAHETGRVARVVHAALQGAAPHGVPFSAQLAADGLLSWGGDPPRDAGPIGRRPESWRLSVCRRLAETLVTAQQVSLRTTHPVDCALARLALDGVDIRFFTPAGLEAPELTPTAQPLSP